MKKSLCFLLLISVSFLMFSINVWAITKEEEDKYCNEVIQKLYEDDGDEGQTPSEEAKKGICNRTSGCMWNSGQCISKQWETEYKSSDNVCRDKMPWFYDAYQTEYTNEKDYCEATSNCMWLGNVCVAKWLGPGSPPTGDSGDEKTIDPTCIGVLDETIIGDLKNLFNVMKIVAPLMVVAISTYEYIAAFSVKNADELAKVNKKMLTRLILVAVLYFLPVILNLLFDLLDDRLTTCID